MKKLLPAFAAFIILFNLPIHAQSTNPAPYCDASFDDMDGTFNVADQIKSVSFGTLSNTSNAQYAFPHYVFYNNLSVPNLTIGAAYSFSATFEVHGGAGFGIWIDYNHNNVFEVTEKVAGSIFNAWMEISDNTMINESITISPIAMAGQTRMRVRIVEDDMYTGANGAAISACNASATAEDIMDWGETEDYIVNIISSVGIPTVEIQNSELVFPNPAISFLNIASKNSTNYRIVNLTGSLIQSGIVNSFKQINIETLAHGVYFIQLFENDKTIAVKRFVKA